MKKLEEFYTVYVNEAAGRPKGSKNKPKDVVDKPWPTDPKELANDERIKNAKKAKDIAAKDTEKVVINGKTESPKKAENAKEGDFKQVRTIGFTLNVANPKDFLPWDELKEMKSTWTRNVRMLTSAVKSGRNFFVRGRAGWAKTQYVLKVAGQFGYDVITVYLNHATATDLGGIPVPIEDENGNRVMDYAIPGYAQYMLKHPDRKFILFFDEMNQAQPDVLNGLMPIALEHVVAGIDFEDQIIVGAAGNLDSENDSLNSVNGPLLSRFKVIDWLVDTDDWNAHFEWAHKKYDDVIGAEAIDKIASYKEYWRSPRDITMNIYDWLKANKDGCAEEPEDILESLLQNCVPGDDDESLSFDKESRQFEKDMQEMAQYMYDYAEGNISSENSKGSRKRGEDMMDLKNKETVINALVDGYYYYSTEEEDGDGNTYLVTKENLFAIFDAEVFKMNQEVVNKLIQQIEDSGKKVRFKTNDEGKEVASKRGWEQVFDFKNPIVTHNITLKAKAEPNKKKPTHSGSKD